MTMIKNKIIISVRPKLPMMFSIGYAAGYDDGDFEKDDIMASLKIL